VLVGTAAADAFVAWRFVAALVVALGLQVGVNYANDYFDGIRGVDAPGRLGPPRLVAAGLASPPAVLVAALVSIGVAGVAGLALALATAPALILFVGALALLAAFAYSGGPRPYAALGLGEVMVFLFFGLMATSGAAFVMTETVPASTWWCGIVLGLLAVAILVSNNLRDIPTDEAAGKRTLAVRLGDRRTRTLYRSCVVGASAAIVIGVCVFIVDERAGLTQWGLLGLAGWIPAIRPMDAVGEASGADLIPVLTGTAVVHAATGLLLALGLLLARTA
jgi:1,4-dihydroxy-2-naphthoate octaprenyltransferase